MKEDIQLTVLTKTTGEELSSIWEFLDQSYCFLSFNILLYSVVVFVLRLSLTWKNILFSPEFFNNIKWFKFVILTGGFTAKFQILWENVCVHWKPSSSKTPLAILKWPFKQTPKYIVYFCKIVMSKMFICILAKCTFYRVEIFFHNHNNFSLLLKIISGCCCKKNLWRHQTLKQKYHLLC